MYALSFPNHHLQYKILHNFFVLQTMNIAEALLETGLYILVVLNPAFPFQILSHSFGKSSKEKVKNEKPEFKANAQMHVCRNISITTSLVPKPFMF